MISHKNAATPVTITTGALILAAGMSSRMGRFKPMLAVGSESIVRRIISTLRRAGADPIVIVTGHQAELLEDHVADTGVVCLRNELYATTQMLDSVNIGLAYLKGRCDQILITPSDVPLFSTNTVQRLIACGPALAAPLHGDRRGHPLLLPGRLVSHVQAYKGPDGLAGALKTSGCTVDLVKVDDEGILIDTDTPDDYEKMLHLYRSNSERMDCYD